MGVECSTKNLGHLGRVVESLCISRRCCIKKEKKNKSTDPLSKAGVSFAPTLRLSPHPLFNLHWLMNSFLFGAAHAFGTRHCW